MNRIDLVEQLMEASGQTALAQLSFAEKPRRYTLGEDTLYMREVHYIVAIGVDGRPTIGEMAQRLNVTHGAVAQIATRLEKKGYIVRTKDPADKRQTVVSLTEKGREVCAAHIAYDRGEYRWASEFLAEFSDEELERFIQYERKMRAMFTIHG